jgi:hypothetical protein
MLKRLLKLASTGLLMDDADPRVVALRKYARDALPCSDEIAVRVLRDDTWAWFSAERNGESISIDVRGVSCATAALAAALRTIAAEAARAGR